MARPRLEGFTGVRWKWGYTASSNELLLSMKETADTDYLPILMLDHEDSAVNYLKVTASATGNDVTLEPAGDDTDINLVMQAKGAGTVSVTGVSFTSADITGTEETSFEVDTAGSVPAIALSSYAGGSGDYTVTLKPAATLTANRTILFPDVADTVVTLTATQTLTNKTLTLPTIGDFTNAQHDHSDTAGGGSISAGATTGTTYNTFDIDSDNLTGVLRLQTTTGGTAHTVTLTNSVTTAARVVTLPDLTGTLVLKDVTGQKGYLEMDGSTSGGIKVAPIAVGTAVTTVQNQAGSACTITLPISTCTLGGLGLANVWTAAQSVTLDDTTDGVEDMLVLTHSSSDNAATAGDGIGISWRLENATGTSTVEEWASLDVLSTTITNGSEDGDVLLKTMLGGTVSQVLLVDASDQSLIVGANSTDADGVYRMKIYPVTASRGSLVLSATAHASADYATTVTNATDLAGAITITLPSATCTLGGLGLANAWTAAQSMQYDDASTNTVLDVLTLKRTSSGTAANGVGAGVAFQVEDAGGSVSEVASMDVVLTNAGAGTEDADIVWKTAFDDGTVTQALAIDASANELVVGADTSLVTGIRIYPATTASGSFLLLAADQTGDTVVTVTPAAMGQASVVTIPDPGASTADFVLSAGDATISGVKTFTGTSLIVDNGTTPVLTIQSGNTNTGYIEVKGKTSGMLKLMAADSTAQTVTFGPAAQTGGAGSVTIPDLGGTAETVGLLGLAQTWSGANTFSAAPTVAYSASATNTVYDALALSQETDGVPAAGLGVGVTFDITDLGGATPEEQASIDAVMATVTDGAEDCDMVFKLNLNGAITQALKLDSVNQTMVVGQNATDADGFYKATLYPVTASKGSLVLQAVANNAADVQTIIQNGQSGATSTFTLPTAASGTIALTSQADGSIAVADVAAAVQDLMPNLTITAGAEGAHARLITFQAKDAAGNNLTERCIIHYWVNATAAYGAPAATGTDTFGAPGVGLILSTLTAKQDYIVQTDASGVCSFTLTHNDAGSSRWITAEMDGKLMTSAEITFDGV